MTFKDKLCELGYHMWNIDHVEIGKTEQNYVDLSLLPKTITDNNNPFQPSMICNVIPELTPIGKFEPSKVTLTCKRCKKTDDVILKPSLFA